MQRKWQPKYCVLDLTKFEFKYAKNPREHFNILKMKDIIDIYVEDDPKKRNDSKSIFSLTR